MAQTGAGSSGRRAVYDWQEEGGMVFAAGGGQPAVVQQWDLQQELCVQQVQMAQGPGGHAPPAVEHIACSKARSFYQYQYAPSPCLFIKGPALCDTFCIRGALASATLSSADMNSAWQIASRCNRACC